MGQLPFDIERLASVFGLKGKYLGYVNSNNGHINNTYAIDFQREDGTKASYILQEINTFAFKNPDELMANIVGVTAYLRDMIIKNGGNPDRETMTVYFTNDGKSYFRDDNGACWRLYNYISDSHTYQTIESPEVFRNAAKAFGKFIDMLDKYPIETLYDTIPNFHNTVSRFADFKAAVAADVKGRAKDVESEINFILEREKDAGVLLGLLKNGELPLRVTHNDTKLNNVMFDNETDEGVCVIDLDTVMPGLSLYDFGDSIRFGANTATEDERDVSKVSLDLGLFESFTLGFLEAAGKSLNLCEVRHLPFSAKLMTFECGMRFLTDYLNGDVYFRISCEDHNLVRCRTQLSLVEDIERKLDKMLEITMDIYNRVTE